MEMYKSALFPKQMPPVLATKLKSFDPTRSRTISCKIMSGGVFNDFYFFFIKNATANPMINPTTMPPTRYIGPVDLAAATSPSSVVTCS